MTELIRIRTADRGSIDLEYQLIDAQGGQASPGGAPALEPLLIFLHEGLGSVAQWRSWPQRICAQLKMRGLVYSRYGYGASSPRPAHELWQPDYLHIQAREDLPALLQALGLEHERPWIYGHSDGGTIALLFAAAFAQRPRGIVIAAPHVFVEEMTLQAIRDTSATYTSSGLRERLRRYHQDPDSAFFGWSNAWLNPPFAQWDIRAEIGAISCPVLAVQGRGDEYASLEQIYAISQAVAQTQELILEDCGHTPHREQSAALGRALQGFMG